MGTAPDLTGTKMEPEELIRGPVIKLGDSINTDLIYPGAYLNLVDPKEIAMHALEGIDPDFPEKIVPGSIVVGGVNFGCGSSREGAVTCLKHAGVGAVLAKSFARIYFRNMINQGFLPVECPEAVDAISDGQEISIDPVNGKILVGEKTFQFERLPEFILGVIASGGLIPYTRNSINI